MSQQHPHHLLRGDAPPPWVEGRRFLPRLGVACAVALTASLLHALLSTNGYRRFMLAYLTAFAFVLSLSLGGLFFVIIQHLTRAGWSVLVRRPAEAMAANMPLVAVLFLPIALSVAIGNGEIYPWAQWNTHGDTQAARVDAHASHDEHAGVTDHAAPPGYAHQKLDDLTLAKRAWLNPIFFLVRWILFLALWSWMGLSFWRTSVEQDDSGDPHLTTRMERFAAPAAVLFGLTVTFASFDLLMSLNPHWYSTILGGYFFSGAVVGGLATLILLVLSLQRAGVLTRHVGEAHYLDLGRFLFAFVFFWAYIAFSQYLLLWYANLPETTGWFYIRGASGAANAPRGWTPVLLLLLFGHFLVPFLGLLSRHVKRRPKLLAFWAAWLLLMHYVDLLWLVMPEAGPTLTLGLVEVGVAAGLGLIWSAGLLHLLTKNSLVPASDPRLLESLRSHTAY